MDLICALVFELQPSALIVPAVVRSFISPVYRTCKPGHLIQRATTLYRRHVLATERRNISLSEQPAKLTVRTQRSTTTLSTSLASNEGKRTAAAYSKQHHTRENFISIDGERGCSSKRQTEHFLFSMLELGNEIQRCPQFNNMVKYYTHICNVLSQGK